ncbi:hypothetical protein [Streptomyces noursei]
MSIVRAVGYSTAWSLLLGCRNASGTPWSWPTDRRRWERYAD